MIENRIKENKFDECAVNSIFTRNYQAKTG